MSDESTLRERIAALAFDLAERYDLPLTNNEPRVQDGQQLHHIADFAADIERAVEQEVMAAVAKERAYQDAHRGGKYGWKNGYERGRRDVAAAVEAVHAKGYNSVYDETWEQNARCDECDQAWPCATITALKAATEKDGE